MSGMISMGGLMSGLDTNSIIESLVAIERQRITRVQRRLPVLEQQQETVMNLRTQLSNLLSAIENFQTDSIVDEYEAASSETSVLTSEVSGSNPVMGSYAIDVQQLASATTATSSGSVGAAIDPSVALNSSGIGTAVTAGAFSINGVAFTVDPATDSLDNLLADINASAAGVTATYDPATDHVTIENTAAGDTSVINFGAQDDDSNFLAALSMTQATQTTGANGSTVVESTRNLGSVNPLDDLAGASFGGGAITSGSFQINGVTVNVDASVGGDSLIDVVNRINDSDAGVTASYDSSNDTIRVVSDTLGSRTIRFTSGSSNFLDVMNLTTAVQDAGDDAQFTINGGAVLTRNTNEVSDAIGGITLNLLSAGTSTVTVSSDNDAVVESVQSFIDEFNGSVQAIAAAIGQGGPLENDSSIRSIEGYLRTVAFTPVEGMGGDLQSLLDIGISTGSAFDSERVSLLQLDEEALREALQEDRAGVAALFSNKDETGVVDQFVAYLEEATGFQGFLNERGKAGGSIDRQITSLEDRIETLEERAVRYQERLQRQFSQLEVTLSNLQSQAASLAF